MLLIMQKINNTFKIAAQNRLISISQVFLLTRSFETHTKKANVAPRQYATQNIL